MIDIMGRAANPQDPFDRWVALQSWSNDPTNRLDESVDLAFWDRIAETYDGSALVGRAPAVLHRVLELVPTGATVLEVGAGTGAFTLPIAGHAAGVTALDYSSAMLRVLRTKLDARPEAASVDVVLSRWEDASLEPHDVAFAANAFYRILDLRQALTKFVAVARRRGIVVWSIGRDEHGHDAEYRAGPDYVHLVDGLFALNVFAQVEIIERVAVIWWDAPPVALPTGRGGGARLGDNSSL